jgi:hypothetical protein
MVGAVFTAIPQLKERYKMVWFLMAIESIVGIGFIVWLIFLQGAVIKRYCIYCLTSHFFGTIAYGLTVFKVPIWSQYRHSRLITGCISSAILTFMICVHIFVVPNMHASQDAADIEYALPAQNSGMIQFGQTKPSSRTVHLLNNQLNFDIYKLPVLGSREAEHVMIELSDYCCPSCRKLDARMSQLREFYDLDFCIVFLPTPMNAECNPNVKKTPYGFKDACTLANYSMAVNIADQSKFEKYHEYLMKGNHPPSTAKARKKAEELVGAKKFEEALKDPRIKQWIGTATGVQGFIKAKTIPRLISPKHVVSYSGGSKAGFAKLIKNALDLPEIKKKQ